jgi:hypothetical protein
MLCYAMLQYAKLIVRLYLTYLTHFYILDEHLQLTLRYYGQWSWKVLSGKLPIQEIDFVIR